MNLARCLVVGLATSVLLSTIGVAQRVGQSGRGTPGSFSPRPPSGTWQQTNNSINVGLGLPLLLTDGTVIIQDGDATDWWKLTPDSSGSYVNGTWSQIASTPSNYGPLYFGSAVLANGKVVVIGGEYNESNNGVWTNLAATYDPVADAWSPLAAPNGWNNIGDCQCAVLPTGQLVLADPFNASMAELDPTTLTWTALNGANKADRFDEEGWVLLPEGTILTCDAIDAPNTEKYIPSQDAWISAGNTPQSLEDPGSQELGPMVLRPDGTVYAVGATGHSAIYTPGASPTSPGSWAAGPDFPNIGGQLDTADGPACLLPNGNVLCASSPGVFNTPLYFFEFDGTSLTQVAGIPNSPGDSSYVCNMLMLPTGQVLLTDFSGDVEIYTPSGGPQDAWRPTVTTAPSYVARGQSYSIRGTQFNGLSQSSGYGDDSTNATNYPLARIQNTASGHVVYCRTHDHSSMGVATGSNPVSTYFDVPAGIETGPSTLYVVANGIASAPQPINVVAANVVLPSGLSILRGILDTGSLASLFYTDGNVLAVTSGPTLNSGEAPIQIVTTGRSPSLSPSTFQISVTTNVNSTGLTQTISLWNYVTNAYVVVDSRGATTSNQNVTVSAPGAASQYVSASGAVQARVAYIQTGPTSLARWQANVDLLNWTIQ